ncbi:MAG: glycosyl transferase family 1 [Sumerlaeia bacterium]
MARIQLIIPAHLCMVPRPQKEAVAIAELGHEVLVTGVWFDEEKAALDHELQARMNIQFTPAVDLRAASMPSVFGRFISRLQNYVAKNLYAQAGYVSPQLYGVGVQALYQQALNNQAALIIAHGEAGLWVVHELKKKRHNVGVDFEDWYSKDLLPSARIHRPIKHLARMEKALLRSSSYCVTTSKVLSKALGTWANVEPPKVVYNAFPDEDHSLSSVSSSAHFTWFSQTIGPGRGLELLFEALRKIQPIDDCTITLRGNLRTEYKQWLHREIPTNWVNKIEILAPVPPWKLHHALSCATVGLALESNQIVSRNLTITNKVFQYLQAGLQVLATPTAGQQEVLRTKKSLATLLHSWDSTELAKAIQYSCENPLSNEDRFKIINFHDKYFSWAKQKLVIQHEVERALS